MNKNLLMLGIGLLLAGLVTVAPSANAQDTALNGSAAESAVVRQDDLTISLSAIGRLETQQLVDLTFGGAAPVVELLIEAGEQVEAGAPLARLDTTDAESALRNAEIALAQAQATYNNLVAPPRDVDIAVAEASLNAAYASLNAAGDDSHENDTEIARLQAEVARNQLWQTQLNRDITLDIAPQFRNNNGGAQAGEIRLNSDVAGAEYGVEIADAQYADTANTDSTIGAVSSANAQVVQAQANLDSLVDGASAAERRAAEIDLHNAELDVQRAREQLNDLTLTAPFSGIVAAENLTVGEFPPPGSAITLIDDNQYIIKVSVDETDIVNVAPGQRVELVVDALPNQRLRGTVTKVESAPVVEGQLVTYEATVTLEPTEAPVRPGMSATARLVLNEIEDALVIPNRFIQVDTASGLTAVVVRGADGQFMQIPVTLGARNETESQVISGLQAGQEIFLLPQVDTGATSPFPQPPGGGMGLGLRGGN